MRGITLSVGFPGCRESFSSQEVNRRRIVVAKEVYLRKVNFLLKLSHLHSTHKTLNIEIETYFCFVVCKRLEDAIRSVSSILSPFFFLTRDGGSSDVRTSPSSYLCFYFMSQRSVPLSVLWSVRAPSRTMSVIRYLYKSSCVLFSGFEVVVYDNKSTNVCFKMREDIHP